MFKAAEQAMSNEEVFKYMKPYQHNLHGNSQIKTNDWQRKAGGIAGMINELLSESSSRNDDEQKQKEQN